MKIPVLDLHSNTSTLHDILQDLIPDQIGRDDEREQLILPPIPREGQDDQQHPNDHIGEEAEVGIDD